MDDTVGDNEVACGFGMSVPVNDRNKWIGNLSFSVHDIIVERLAGGGDGGEVVGQGAQRQGGQQEEGEECFFSLWMLFGDCSVVIFELYRKEVAATMWSLPS